MAAKKKPSRAVTLTAAPDELRGILTCALPWTGDKENRPHVACVHIEGSKSGVAVVATDGCGLWVCEESPIKATGKFVLDIDADDARLILRELNRLLREGKLDEIVGINVGKGVVGIGAWRLALKKPQTGWPTYTFPPWRKVVAIQPKGRHLATSLSAHYLARIGKTLPGFTDENNAVRIQARGALDPVRFDGEVGDFAAYVILMPRNMGDAP